MAEYEQLHVDRCPKWIKSAMKEWGQKQEPEWKMSRITVTLLKKWIESGFTMPQIGEDVDIENQAEIEKQRKLEELQRQIAELQK